VSPTYYEEEDEDDESSASSQDQARTTTLHNSYPGEMVIGMLKFNATHYSTVFPSRNFFDWFYFANIIFMSQCTRLSLKLTKILFYFATFCYNINKQQCAEFNDSNNAKHKRWTLDEHIEFLISMFIHGIGSWSAISKQLETKSPKQVQSHAQKFMMRRSNHSRVKKSIHDFCYNKLVEKMKDKHYRYFLSQTNKKLDQCMLL